MSFVEVRGGAHEIFFDTTKTEISERSMCEWHHHPARQATKQQSHFRIFPIIIIVDIIYDPYFKYSIINECVS